jgi:rSAM/selenodomain-associated transferase 1
MNSDNALILFFIKYPEPGRVKTRLAASLSVEAAAELYRNFVLDTLIKLEASGLSFKICFYPEEKRKPLVAWLGAKHQYIPQMGKDLGERMKVALSRAFAEGHKQVILIGSDFPDLPSSFLREAVDALATHDAVMGPAKDGGYYLIGFRDESFLPRIFEDMAWGTKVVFDQTLSTLIDHQRRVHVLPTWGDIDTIEDLKALIKRAKATDFLTSKTMSYLSNLKIT